MEQKKWQKNKGAQYARAATQSESQQQQALFKWVAYAKRFTPELENLFAIPNGAHVSMNNRKRLIREGLRSGVPDLFLAVPRANFAGLFIELKRDKKAILGESQKKWIKKLKKAGYAAGVCYGFNQTVECINEYLNKQ